VNQAARQEVSKAAGIFARTGRFLLLGLEIADGVTTFLAAFTPVELNQGEDRLTAQLKAALQPPKTLEELQQTPTENAIGYEKHHIVEQNDDNVRKRPVQKFGWAAIDDPTNVVWVPHFSHIEISAEYSSIPNNDGGPTLRDRVKKSNERCRLFADEHQQTY
jgi:hypothetical protein